MSELPVRKWTTVWVERRKARKSTNYTLKWVEFGRQHFRSLDPHASLAYARECRRRKEVEPNNFGRRSSLDPSPGMPS